MHHAAEPEDTGSPPPRGAFRIAGIYGLVGAVWIVASDLLLRLTTKEPLPATLLQTFKGLAFIAVTTGLVYVLVSRHESHLLKLMRSLSSSRRRLRTIYEQAPVMIAIVHRGRIESLNTVGRDLLGIGKGEQSPAISEVLTPESAAVVQRAMESARAMREPVWMVPARLLTRAGGAIDVELSISVCDEREELLQVVAIDVSERRAMQATLVHAQKMEAIGQLAAGVAHDFRNLLTVMFGQLDLIRLGLPKDHPAMSNLDIIESAAREAGEVTRSLLTFARSSSSGMAPVSAEHLVTQSAGMIRSVLPRKIELDVRVHVAPATLVLCDIQRMQQALLNLAINARDAMSSGGRIQLLASMATLPGESTERARWVAIDVTDSGPGIPEAVAEQLFRPFFTTKPEGAGTGLGLTITQTIVQDHGGRLSLASNAGKGTTFRILLPVHEGQTSAREPQPAPPQAPSVEKPA